MSSTARTIPITTSVSLSNLVTLLPTGTTGKPNVVASAVTVIATTTAKGRPSIPGKGKVAHLNKGAIIGIIIIVAIAILALLVVLFVLWRRRSKRTAYAPTATDFPPSHKGKEAEGPSTSVYDQSGVDAFNKNEYLPVYVESAAPYHVHELPSHSNSNYDHYPFAQKTHAG